MLAELLQDIAKIAGLCGQGRAFIVRGRAYYRFTVNAAVDFTAVGHGQQPKPLLALLT